MDIKYIDSSLLDYQKNSGLKINSMPKNTELSVLLDSIDPLDIMKVVHTKNFSSKYPIEPKESVEYVTEHLSEGKIYGAKIVHDSDIFSIINNILKESRHKVGLIKLRRIKVGEVRKFEYMNKYRID